MTRWPTTLNLTDADLCILDGLSKRKDVSKTAVPRQALRLYQWVDSRVEQGDELLHENARTKETKEVMLL